MAPMGRPPTVSKEEVIQLIQKYMEFFKTNEFPSNSAQVWKDMSRDLNGRWKPHSVYTHVRENKNGNLDEARRNLGINVDASRPITTYAGDYSLSESAESLRSDGSSYHDEDDDFDVDAEEFPLVLSATEWEQIKPNDENSKNVKNRLQPRVWPNIITKAFWNAYKMPCAFLAKWSYVRTENIIDQNENVVEPVAGDFYVKFKGICKSNTCKNKLVGIATEKPIDGKLRLTIKTRDTRDHYHEDNKRPLNGPERKIIGRELKRRRAAGFRQQLLANNMEFGQNEPPWIQKASVYRQAKMVANQEDLGIKPGEKKSVFTSIQEMLQNVRYSSAIRDLGGKKFHVFYCSPEQIFVEKEYCRIKKKSSKICLDATGKVVKKFEIYPGRKTGHIFLYTVTINFENKTLPVYQMLSEKHSAPFIRYWLDEWVRGCGATVPAEAVADQGRALLLAMCQSFNGMTIKQYVDTIFQWAKDGHVAPQPFITVIRIDVAHQIAAVARWKCLTAVGHHVVRGFLIRAFAMLVDCQSLVDFEHVFVLTCMVALHHDQQDTVMLSGESVSILDARNRLEELMADRKDNITSLETSAHGKEIDREVEQALNEIEEICDTDITTTHWWIKHLISKAAGDNKEKENCKDVNAFYCPKFVESLEKAAKLFPLWSPACLPGIQEHASTAAQEGYFAELENRIFEGIPLPCSAVRFLQEHIDDLNSGANEIAAKLKHYNHNHRKPIPEPSSSSSTMKRNGNSDLKTPSANRFFHNARMIDDSDLGSKEEWRGLKNKSPSFGDVHEMDTEMPEELKNNHSPYKLSGEMDLPIVSSTLNDSNIGRPTSLIDHDYLGSSIDEAGEQTASPGRLHKPPSPPKQLISEKKSTKKAFYFRSCPQVKFMNDRLDNGGKRGFLLRNGSQLGVIKIRDIAVNLQNTCGFDAIINVLQLGALYFSQYYSGISTSKNHTLKFLCKFLKSGPTKEILEERVRLLNEFYPLVEDPEAPSIVPLKLNAEDSITTIWKNLFSLHEPMEPSATKSGVCDNPSCVLSVPADIPYFSVNIKKINKYGIWGLQEAILFQKRPSGVKCRQKNCSGTIREILKPNFHVFVDLDTRLSNEQVHGLKCRLAEFPVVLHLLNEYRLLAVIERIPGHFIGYFRKPSGQWLICDDMATEIAAFADNEIVAPIGAIYVLCD